MTFKTTAVGNIVRFGLAALLLTAAMTVAAHQAALSSTPEDGASLQASPESIGIEFDGPMRITQFEVSGPGGAVPLTDDPDSEPSQQYFVTPAETLEAGDYEVSWRGLAGDGHMMSGRFGFSVEE